MTKLPEMFHSMAISLFAPGAPGSCLFSGRAPDPAIIAARYGISEGD